MSEKPSNVDREEGGCAFTTYSNPPAFPLPSEQIGTVWRDQPGMSLRDYFAAAALQGLLASPSDAGFTSIEQHYNHYAKLSYGYADAMLAARDAI